MLEGLKYINPHEIGCYWHESAEKFGSPNLKWCENTLCQVISEPANTWSNLGYIILSIVLMILFRKSSKSLKMIGPVLMATGVGSYYYHMSNFYISQISDFVGMFLLVYWFIALNLQRLGKINYKQSLFFMLSMTLINTIILHLLYSAHMNIQVLVLIALLIIITLELIIRKNNKDYSLRYLIWALGLLGVAETFSLLDLKRVLCDPDNHIIQGHAIWHALGSIGLFIAGLFYKQFDKELE